MLALIRLRRAWTPALVLSATIFLAACPLEDKRERPSAPPPSQLQEQALDQALASPSDSEQDSSQDLLQQSQKIRTH